jgi:hypothetical protein
LDERSASNTDLEGRITGILQEMHANIRDLEATAVVNLDGLVLASHPPSPGDERGLAALAAATVALGEASSHRLRLGGLSQILVRSRRGFHVTMMIGGEAMLTVRAGAQVRPGLILLKMKQAARQIERCLQAT